MQEKMQNDMRSYQNIKLQNPRSNQNLHQIKEGDYIDFEEIKK